MTAALQARFREKFGRSRHGINPDGRVRAERRREVDGATVDHDEVDLGMWHATGLDRVFNRGFFAQLPDNLARTTPRPNEKRQIAMKNEAKGERLPRGRIHDWTARA